MTEIAIPGFGVVGSGTAAARAAGLPFVSRIRLL